MRRDILIEELVAEVPDSVPFLRSRGIPPVACGEPLWGTLEDAAKERGFTDAEIDALVAELARLPRGGR